MPHNFAANSFHTKKLCSRLPSILDENRPYCVFETPFGGLIGATYDDHHRLIGKRIVDYLSVLIELFRLRSYGRISVENRRLRSNGSQLTLNFR